MKYTSRTGHVSQESSSVHPTIGSLPDSEAKIPVTRGRPRGARGRTHLVNSVRIPDSDGELSQIPTNEEAAESTAQQFILSHLAQHPVDTGVPEPDLTSFANFIPGMSFDTQIDPTLDETGHVTEEVRQPVGTPSVLSRLKKGTLGSCDICGRTETSVWRKLTLGGDDHKVCNGAHPHGTRRRSCS